MKYIDLNGENGELRVGEIPCGIGFQIVILDYHDVCNPEFTAWFMGNIFHRMCFPTLVTPNH